MRIFLAAALLSFGCGDDDGGGADAGGRDGSIDAELPTADAGTDAGECLTPDSDGDGRRSMACGGDDCDDDDLNRFPGNTEVCDAGDHDEDCDDTTFGFRDGDMDGVADARCCNMREDGLFCGTDCDDSSPTVAPTSPEVCNGRDDDCDENSDEGVLDTFIIDGDGDDFGSDAPDALTMEACSVPDGYADNRNDCNDGSASVHPAALERCDSIDNNCDGETDPGCMCMAGMSRDCGTDVGVCELGMQVCVDGAWSGCAGGSTPGAESCNGADDDCDGATDEGTLINCYPDPDHDDYAALGAPATPRCMCTSDETSRAPGPLTADCRPSLPGTHPSAPEVCDRIDQDCSIDGGLERAEDFDGDGFTGERYTACTGGFPRTDCDDEDDRAFPGQSEYFSVASRGAGGYDFDCDGTEEPPEPSAVSCVSSGMLCTTCTGSGFVFSPSARCGGRVTDLEWSCRCERFACVAARRTGDLPCR
jgi:hypothetical protein